MRIALCIPTYENEECVRDMLENCLPYYLSYGIDVVYFDSSSSDRTEKLVREKSREYRGRLIYHKASQEMRTNEKVYMFYQGHGYSLEEYDYIWVCSDAVQFTKSAMESIYHVLEEGYDVIINDPYNNDEIGDREYKDGNAFFQDCAWGRGGMTLLGAMILNVRSMLQGVEWKKYEKYLDDQIICYSHLSFVFNRILELHDFRGYHLALENRQYRSSAFKKASSWYYYAFSIICGQYVKTIEALPECYVPKTDVIRKYGESYGLGNVQRIMEFRMENVLNLQVFRKYFREWDKVSPIGVRKIFLISVLPKRICRRICYGNRKKFVERFKDFYRKHDRILLYGAGRFGMIYAKYLEKEKLPFEGFCVSDAQGKDSYLGYPLYERDEFAFTTQVGVIVALQEDNARDVLQSLEKCGIATEHIFYSQEFYKIASFELGYRD